MVTFKKTYLGLMLWLNKELLYIKTSVAQAIILQMLQEDISSIDKMGELGTQEILKPVTPLVHQKSFVFDLDLILPSIAYSYLYLYNMGDSLDVFRIQRSIDIARKNINGSMSLVEALLDVKGKAQRRFPFF